MLTTLPGVHARREVRQLAALEMLVEVEAIAILGASTRSCPSRADSAVDTPISGGPREAPVRQGRGSRRRSRAGVSPRP